MAEREANAEALVEEGLKHYSEGRLDEALTRWRAALELVPDHHRAREYLKYVEDNRGALEDSFRVARVAPAAQAQSEVEVEFVAEPASARSAPEPESDPSFVRFAAEIESTAAAVEKEVTGKVIPATKVFDADDYTPRIDLAELKAKVAATKHRLSTEMSTVTRDQASTTDGPEPSTSPADLDTAPRVSLADLDTAPRVSPADLDTATILKMGRPKLAAAALEGPPEPPRQEPELVVPSRSATPSAPSPAVVPSAHRDRRATPLTLISGGAVTGGPPPADFEPMEATPVGLIPEPSRLVSEGHEGIERLVDAAAQDEMAEARDSTTPAKLQGEKPRPRRPSDFGLAATGGPGGEPQRRSAEKPPGSTAIGLGPGGPSVTGQPEAGRTTTPLGVELFGTRTTPVGEAADGTAPPAGKPSEQRLESMISGAQQLFEQGTFEGSLWLCERVIAVDPEHKAAKELLERNRQILLQEYRRQIGEQRQVPVVQVPQHEIVWHKLDHRAGFLLSRIDGQLSYEDLLDVSGMSEFEAYRILAQLLSQGVIGSSK